MSGGDTSALLIIAAWLAWSLANVSARVGRVADALEALKSLAERNRR